MENNFTVDRNAVIWSSDGVFKGSLLCADHATALVARDLMGADEERYPDDIAILYGWWVYGTGGAGICYGFLTDFFTHVRQTGSMTQQQQQQGDQNGKQKNKYR